LSLGRGPEKFFEGFGAREGVHDTGDDGMDHGQLGFERTRGFAEFEERLGGEE
jgi:hypothetical protein